MLTTLNLHANPQPHIKPCKCGLRCDPKEVLPEDPVYCLCLLPGAWLVSAIIVKPERFTENSWTFLQAEDEFGLPTVPRASLRGWGWAGARVGVNFMSIHSSLIRETNPCVPLRRWPCLWTRFVCSKSRILTTVSGRHFVTENLQLCFQGRLVSRWVL